MESKKKIPFPTKNINRNLFPKTYSFNENNKYSSKEKQKKCDEVKPKLKLKKSFIYHHKIPKIENKKESISKPKSKITIDSKTEIRLPLEYIDLSYDNLKNE